jgi:curved DNA-binding protein CbpA
MSAVFPDRGRQGARLQTLDRQQQNSRASHATRYRVLGVSPGVSSEELHDAYRRLVKLHYPDRNDGSEESARRFAEIQEAYEELRARGRLEPHRTAEAAESINERTATLERELREAQASRCAAGQRVDRRRGLAAARPSLTRRVGRLGV